MQSLCSSASGTRAVALRTRSTSRKSHRLCRPQACYHSSRKHNLSSDKPLDQILFPSSLDRNGAIQSESSSANDILCSQGPSPMLMESFTGVISQLFQNRIIRVGGAVDDEMANLIVAELLYLDSVDDKKDIIMYVNSPGGSVTAGMAIFDTMKHIRPDVSTVCVGLAASMGAFLLASGTKGKRYALPNSRIMIHQPLGGAQGQAADIEIQANEILHHKHTLNSYLSAFTGQSYEKIEEDTDRDFFMSAKEASEYGIVDQVIRSTKGLYAGM